MGSLSGRAYPNPTGAGSTRAPKRPLLVPTRSRTARALLSPSSTHIGPCPLSPHRQRQRHKKGNQAACSEEFHSKLHGVVGSKGKRTRLARKLRLALTTHNSPSGGAPCSDSLTGEGGSRRRGRGLQGGRRKRVRDGDSKHQSIADAEVAVHILHVGVHRAHGDPNSLGNDCLGVTG